MGRFLSFLKLIVVLTALMFVTWGVSATFFPQGVFRPFFSGRFASSVGELTFWRVFLANFFVGFLGIQLMNLFRVGKHAGGLYVLPVFWIIYGLLLGTNSFVFADAPIPFSLAVIWTRTGFSELAAYALGYEGSRGWTLWEQGTLWSLPQWLARKQLQRLRTWLIGWRGCSCSSLL